ncbi:MAG: SDR family NAD(P)-dependent oxidoreductase [Saccharofermentans sp.]|nr:SDR family NAD(P)-dependent oxidoreductase [Saccharofermentans sp.]
MKIAIITGASSGIGKSYVNQLVASKENFDAIWVVARRIERLEELRSLSDKIVPIRCDLGNGIEEITNRLISEKPTVDLLVNCAGMGRKGKIADRSVLDITDTIDLNCTALSALTREAIPFMSKGSRILNVGSTAAFLPQPGFAVYAASKAYVVSFTRALASELKSKGIKVTVACPGPIETEFNGLATDGKSAEFTGFRKLVAADSDKFAQASLKASSKGKVFYVYGFSQKCLHVFSKIVPTGLILSLLYK